MIGQYLQVHRQVRADEYVEILFYNFKRAASHGTCRLPFGVWRLTRRKVDWNRGRQTTDCVNYLKPYTRPIAVGGGGGVGAGGRGGGRDVVSSDEITYYDIKYYVTHLYAAAAHIRTHTFSDVVGETHAHTHISPAI